MGAVRSPQAQRPHLAARCCYLWSFCCRGSGFVPSIGILLRASGNSTGVVSSCGGYTHTCLWGTAVATWLLHLTGGDASSSPIHDVEADAALSWCLLRARWSWPPQKQRYLMVTSAFWYILIKQLFVFVHVLEERVIEKFQHLLTLKCYSQKKEDQFFESNFKKILFFFFLKQQFTR